MKFITVAIVCLVAGLTHGAALSEQVLGTSTRLVSTIQH
jgi:hypothetical protein